tara:strand:- start:174 stop:497 length:324 start_codon:yes stop_codon:yes gene_type:complete
MENDGDIQDSVVMGDVHTGDVHHHTTVTNIDQSTKLELPSFEEASEHIAEAATVVAQGSKDVAIWFGGFLKSTINKVLLLTGFTVLLLGILIYTGSIDADAWIKRIF